MYFGTLFTFSLLFQSQGRFEIMQTLEKLVSGLGSAGSNTHKDIYKACRQAMTDRSMAVRQAAAKVGQSVQNKIIVFFLTFKAFWS